MIIHDTQVRQLTNTLHYPSLDYSDISEELRLREVWHDEHNRVTFNNHNMKAVQQLVDSYIRQEVEYYDDYRKMWDKGILIKTQYDDSVIPFFIQINSKYETRVSTIRIKYEN
jgi:hypothetical protein